MKNLKKQLEVGTEVKFLDSKGFKETATVTDLNDRTFTVESLSTIDVNGVLNIRTVKRDFFYSGKKSHHRYNYGNIVEVIGKTW